MVLTQRASAADSQEPAVQAGSGAVNQEEGPQEVPRPRARPGKARGSPASLALQGPELSSWTVQARFKPGVSSVAADPGLSQRIRPPFPSLLSPWPTAEFTVFLTAWTLAPWDHPRVFLFPRTPRPTPLLHGSRANMPRAAAVPTCSRSFPSLPRTEVFTHVSGLPLRVSSCFYALTQACIRVLPV